jgi:hypothetical protein
MALQPTAYDTIAAVNYAHQWAYSRNPAYYNFEQLGGDCTNFVSQCIFAGAKTMNYGKNPWFYNSGNDKSPSWSGVPFLRDFLVGNSIGTGPYAEETDLSYIQPGDVIQMLFEGKTFQHSLFVVQTGAVPDAGNVLVATHTDDADYRPLAEYDYTRIRYLHIIAVRQWTAY